MASLLDMFLGKTIHEVRVSVMYELQCVGRIMVLYFDLYSVVNDLFSLSAMRDRLLDGSVDCDDCSLSCVACEIR